MKTSDILKIVINYIFVELQSCKLWSSTKIVLKYLKFLKILFLVEISRINSPPS